MMLIITCARGLGGMFPRIFLIKWCDLVHSECSKVSYYQPKNQYFLDNQQPKFCAIFYLQDQSRCALWQQNRYIHILQGGGGEGNSPQKPKKCKKLRLYVFYINYYIPDSKIYPVVMWIQIYASGSGFFLLEWCNLAHSECPEISYYQSKNQRFQGLFSTIVKIIRYISHLYQSSTKYNVVNTFIYPMGVWGSQPQPPPPTFPEAEEIFEKKNQTK